MRWSTSDINFTLNMLIKQGVKHATLDTKMMRTSDLLSLKSSLESRGHIVKFWHEGCNMEVEIVQPCIKLEYPIGYLIDKEVMFKLDGVMYNGKILHIEGTKLTISTSDLLESPRVLSVSDLNENWWIML